MVVGGGRREGQAAADGADLAVGRGRVGQRTSAWRGQAGWDSRGLAWGPRGLPCLGAGAAGGEASPTPRGEAQDIGYAWAAGIHDVESNRYKATSLKDLVEVANRYRKKAPGGSWKAVQDMLEQVYGAKRRMFIYRTR